jgi:hypothetical protein
MDHLQPFSPLGDSIESWNRPRLQGRLFRNDLSLAQTAVTELLFGAVVMASDHFSVPVQKIGCRRLEYPNFVHTSIDLELVLLSLSAAVVGQR